MRMEGWLNCCARREDVKLDSKAYIKAMAVTSQISLHKLLQLRALRLGSHGDKFEMVVAPNVGTREIAATGEGGHFDSALCGFSHSY